MKLERDNLLLQVLSHDVSNTLTVIRSGVTVLKRYEETPETTPQDPSKLKKQSDITNKIKIATDSAIGVLQHVKEFKAIESGKLDLKLQDTSIEEMFNIAAVIFELNLKTKNLKLSLVNHNLNQFLLCHKTSFSNSVFNNLISNAIKFSPPDSEIIIRTELVDDQYKIFIQDFGIGIPDDLAKKLFLHNQSISRLGTNGEQGTGFGLTLAKTYIENYGGKLNFVSHTTGKTGTTFEITLKLAS